MAHAPRMTELNSAQQEIVERGLLASGFSAVLQMPTGAGKTWLAEHAVDSVLRAGGRAVYLTPLRALANELVARWRERFSGYEVGVFTGEHGMRQPYPVPFDRARLLIMTPERLDACTRQWRTHWGWLPDVSLLVVDELHLLGERGRGARLEGALMRVRRLNPFIQILGLSATLGNRAELAEWLGGVHFGSSWRPVPIAWRIARFKRATDKPRILKEEVERCVAGGGQSLVFVQSRRRAEVLAAELRTAGVAAGHHHAGLDAGERLRLEGDFRTGTLRAIVSTGTLEMGLNLPARQVVLYDLQGFDGVDFVPLSVNTVWQRAGRAGRRGFDMEGEVVLIAPNWDRIVDRYREGIFERITSGLVDERALAEQVLAEVASGLARTRLQLDRSFQQSLAAHQQRLPALDRVVGEMIGSGMLSEMVKEGARRPGLQATRLGRIAVRQMLAPSTVLTMARALQAEDAGELTFLDTLLLSVRTDDCEPLIPVDFEELEDVGVWLSDERSTLLRGGHREVQERFAARGRRLLAIIKTALVARAWTRLGNAHQVADTFGCYAFEVRRLSESITRILMAAVAVLTPAKEPGLNTAEASSEVSGNEPSLQRRVRALTSMVAHGLDEQTVTLTFLDGIGGTLAGRLRDAGVADIEDMAMADADCVAGVRGVSTKRAARWIAEAAEKVGTLSAYSLREGGATTKVGRTSWDSRIDPYRVRRALDLNVTPKGDGFLVSGGLEPHLVAREGSQLVCDCADFGKGRTCKHIFAVRMHGNDAELLPFVARLQTSANRSELDLSQLWFDGGAR
jgi:helicase